MRFQACSRLHVLAAGLVLGALPTPSRAADPPARALAENQTPPGARPHIPEFLQMFWSILRHGAEMGPGSGWFHPAQSRYDWSWLASRYDKDHDGAITAEEFEGPEDLFDRLDRDHDGAATAEDFDWSENSAFLRGRALARARFSLFDRNSNGRISREEWDAFFETATKDKEFLSQDDLADLFYGAASPSRQARPSARQDRGPSRWMLLKGLFQGEIGSSGEGPAIGELAPDFQLKTHDGALAVRLADFRGHKPVVLIFGSFT